MGMDGSAPDRRRSRGVLRGTPWGRAIVWLRGWLAALWLCALPGGLAHAQQRSTAADAFAQQVHGLQLVGRTVGQVQLSCDISRCDDEQTRALLMQLIGLEPGQTIEAVALTDAWSRLHRTGLFRAVRIRTAGGRLLGGRFLSQAGSALPTEEAGGGREGAGPGAGSPEVAGQTAQAGPVGAKSSTESPEAVGQTAPTEGVVEGVIEGAEGQILDLSDAAQAHTGALSAAVLLVDVPADQPPEPGEGPVDLFFECEGAVVITDLEIRYANWASRVYPRQFLSEIRKRLRYRKGGDFPPLRSDGTYDPHDQAVIDRQRAQIIKLYADQGYHGTQVELRAKYSGEGHKKVRLELIVDEGSQPYFGSLLVAGNRAFSYSKIASHLTTGEKTPFWPGLFSAFGIGRYDQKRLKEELKEVEQRYRDEGYVSARVRLAGTQTIDDEVLPKVRVREGPFLEVVFEGNQALSKEDLRGVLTFAENGAWDDTEIEASAQAMVDAYQGIGRYFVRVEPRLERVTRNRMRVRFRIFEGAPVYVSRVILRGHERVKREVLEGLMETRGIAPDGVIAAWSSADGVLQDNRIINDLVEIRDYYREQGMPALRFRCMPASTEPGAAQGWSALSLLRTQLREHRAREAEEAAQRAEVAPQTAEEAAPKAEHIAQTAEEGAQTAEEGAQGPLRPAEELLAAQEAPTLWAGADAAQMGPAIDEALFEGLFDVWSADPVADRCYLVVPTEDPRLVEVHIEIDEGHQTTTDRLQVSALMRGLDPASVDDGWQLYQSLGFADEARRWRKGAGLNISKLQQVQGFLLRGLHRDGYLEAKVEPVCELQGEAGPCEGDRLYGAHVPEVRFNVRPGVQTRVSGLLLTGNLRTGDDVIRRELLVKVGEPLGTESLFLSQANLRSLGIFDAVRLETLGETVTGEAQRSRDATVLVTVEESRVQSFDAIIGLQVDSSPLDVGGVPVRYVLGSSVRDRNFFGRALEVGFGFNNANRIDTPQDVMGDFSAIEVGPFVKDRRFFNTRLNLNTELTFEQGRTAQRDAYRQRFRLEGVLSYDFYNLSYPARWGQGLRTNIGLEYFIERRRGLVRNDERPPFGDWGQSVKLVPSVVVDRRDNPLHPYRGWFASLTTEVLFSGADADSLSFKQVLVGQHVSSFFQRRLILVPALRLGAIQSDAFQDNLPSDFLFKAGGDGVVVPVRGYVDATVDACGGRNRNQWCRLALPSEEELAFGVPTIGGRAMAAGSFEVRWPTFMIDDFWFAAFTDVGAVASQWQDMRWGQLFPSVGGGLRWLVTGQIPLRLDVAWPLRETAFAPQEARFHLNIFYTL